MTEVKMLQEIRKALEIVKSVDDALCEKMMSEEHTSDDFKKAQRLSNVTLNIARAISVFANEFKNA